MSLHAEDSMNSAHSGPCKENPCRAGRSWEWIESILRSVVDGLLVTDSNSRVLMMNAAAEELLGVAQTTLFDRSLNDFVKDRRLLKRLREAVMKEEDGGRFEFELGGHSGGIRIVSITTSVHRDSEGVAQGSVFLLREITRERELDRMKNEFITTAAHELRTPLTAIMGFSELLLTRRDLSATLQFDFLTFINQKAENLSRIISDLLDISRIEAGRGLELFREPCDINDLITETVGSYRTCSEKHALEVLLPEERIQLYVDRGKVIQIMENLLSNAFKYSPQGGVVRVSARSTRGAYLLSVEDEGIGMTREQVSRAFDKFYRGDASNSAVEGTGLGLSITKNIVEAHGGRIWLESRKGKGTTAFVALPMTRDQQEPESGIQELGEH